MREMWLWAGWNFPKRDDGVTLGWCGVRLALTFWWEGVSAACYGVNLALARVGGCLVGVFGSCCWVCALALRGCGEALCRLRKKEAADDSQPLFYA
jgi:hypothetical protein